MNGIFVVFFGIPFSGRSKVFGKVAAYAKDRGIKVAGYKERTNSTFMRMFKLAVDKKSEPAATSELAIIEFAPAVRRFLNDFGEYFEKSFSDIPLRIEQISKSLQMGDRPDAFDLGLLIVCDELCDLKFNVIPKVNENFFVFRSRSRAIYSTENFGFGSCVAERMFKEEKTALDRYYYPDVNIFIRSDPKAAVARSFESSKSLNGEDLPVLRYWNNVYERGMDRDDGEGIFRSVDGDKPEKEVAEDIIDILRKYFKKQKENSLL